MTTTERSCPAEVLEWIAWYPDQGLSDRQRGAVEAHAAGCEPCREEISMLLGQAEPEIVAPDPATMLARLRERIEAPESDLQHPAGEERTVPLVAPAQNLIQLRPALAAAAAAALALIGLVAGLSAGGGGEPTLQTATESVASASGAPVLDVVFADDASASHITRALRTIEGEIVGGPTPLGRYRVALPKGGDAGAAARQLRSGETNLVVFAEPALR